MPMGTLAHVALETVPGDATGSTAPIGGGGGQVAQPHHLLPHHRLKLELRPLLQLQDPVLRSPTHLGYQREKGGVLVVGR